MAKMSRVLVFKAEINESMVGSHLCADCGSLYGLVQVERYTKSGKHIADERLYITRIRYSGSYDEPDAVGTFKFQDTTKSDVAHWTWSEVDAAVLANAIEISKTLLPRAYQAYLEYAEAHNWDHCFKRKVIDDWRSRYKYSPLVPFNEMEQAKANRITELEERVAALQGALRNAI